MNINFLGPVLPTDRFVQMAFVEILNIILTANNIMDVNRMLVGRNANPLSAPCRDISGGPTRTTISRCGNGWSTTRLSASGSAYSASISERWQAVTGEGTIR